MCTQEKVLRRLMFQNQALRSQGVLAWRLPMQSHLSPLVRSLKDTVFNYWAAFAASTSFSIPFDRLTQGTATLVLPAPVGTRPYALFTENLSVPAQSTKNHCFAGRFPVAFSTKHSLLKQGYLFSVSLFWWEKGVCPLLHRQEVRLCWHSKATKPPLIWGTKLEVFLV